MLNEGGNNGALLQLTGSRDASFGGSDWNQSDIFEHVRWGAGDNQPNVMRKLIEKNTLVQPLLGSVRDMIYASGVGFFQKNTIDGKTQIEEFTDTRLEDWAWETDLQNYAVSAISQYVDNANIFTKWQYDPLKKWFTLQVLDSFKTRIGKDGKFHVNPYFGHANHLALSETQRINAFNRLDREFNVASTVTVSHSKTKIPGQPFYSFPTWWCSEEAIELANLVIGFHKNGILNGYNIKYLIRMPSDHFDKEGARTGDGKDSKAKWAKFSDNLSGWLAGQKNVNKTMIIKYLRGSDGKMMDNVDVQPLKNEMSDDAYDKVWTKSNQAISNSVGILPTLAGVTSGGSNDSGSQIRTMADYQQHFRTPIPRLAVLNAISNALRMMGYRDVFAGFKEVQITTLDNNPNGSQAVVNNSQS